MKQPISQKLHPPSSSHSAVEAVHPHRSATAPAVVTAAHSALITWQEGEIHILGPGSSERNCKCDCGVSNPTILGPLNNSMKDHVGDYVVLNGKIMN